MTPFASRFFRAGCAAVAGLLLHSMAFAADTILLNGHIYTGDAREPWAQALAISGTQLEAVGSNADIQARGSAGTRVIDLHGRTVVAGFVDSHVHLLFGALELGGPNLSTPESSITPDTPDQFIEKLRAYAASHPQEQMIIGRADFNTAPPFAPSHELLDRAVADRPVIIHNTSEHALWVNAKALALAGLGDRPLQDAAEERGVIRDASGHPQGVLLEAAMEAIERAVLSRIPLEEKLARIRRATHYLNSFGITSVVNATGDLKEIQLYGMLRDRGELTVRTRTSFGSVAVPHRLTPAFLADLETARQRYHDDWVSANLVKFFADGGTGLIPPLVYDPAEYRRIVTELDRRGFQIMTHTLRTDTAHMILDTYATLAKANGARDRRLRIEHAQLIDAADIARFGTLGIIAVMQPSFCCGDNGLNYTPQDTAPTDRWHSLKQAGAVLAFSSDWPCTFPPDPLVGMQEATTRQVWRSSATASILGESLDGAGQGGAVIMPTVYTPSERITVEEAVAAYTTGSAYAAFHENRVGTLAAGKEADLAVLSKDIFSIPAETISTARVVMTMVGGKIVYEADKEADKTAGPH